MDAFLEWIAMTVGWETILRDERLREREQIKWLRAYECS